MVLTGFLREPRPDHLAHSPLSAQFVIDPTLFLSGTIALAALEMSPVTKQFPGSGRAERSASAAAPGTDTPFTSKLELWLHVRLQHQFDAYFH
jgi:hypothetical protein